MSQMCQVRTRNHYAPKRDTRTKTTLVRSRIDAPVIGRLVSIGDTGLPYVEFGAAPEGGPVAARTTVPLDAGSVGREVVLIFELGDPSRPIVTGVLQLTSEPSKRSIPVEADGDRLVLTAQREVVLRCGEASIILTREGKVLIRGKYILSRSAGSNRIKGACVEIN